MTMNSHSDTESNESSWANGDDAGCFASDSETSCLIELNLRGADGRPGMDGQSFFDPHRSAGAHGRRGGDATPAELGQDAASATVKLAYQDGVKNSGALQLSGTVSWPRQSPHSVRDEQPIGDDGYVFIRALGGRGGDGGRGGNGQPGAPGYKGADATRYSSGGNGGPGGDGGDAGSPTDGKDGGSGGEITVAVDEADLGLLMLVKGDLSAGEIGFAGKPAKGGSGGPGGPGGSSYHWTETQHYTDSQGKSQTRTVSHSNPGGSRGRPGRDGSPSSYPARDGQPGSPGRLRIVVTAADGTQRQYASPYDLELVTFDVAGECSTLEPDSLVAADNITVTNVGGMPTPRNYTIRITLPSDEHLFSDEFDLVLPHPLQSGESYTFTTEGLGLRLADVVIDAPRRHPFRLSHAINPQAYLESGIHRPFRNFENEEPIKVQFPIELTEIIALNSLAPGESTRVRWGITNVSDETFDDQYLFRSIRCGSRLLGGDIDLNQLIFFDDSGKPHDLLGEEYQTAVRQLAPGETRWIETRIGIRNHSDVIAYQNFVLGVDLHLQRPNSSTRHSEYRRVDYRHEFIRVSEQYRRDSGSRFLLVANQKTDVGDIEKWTQLADYFGSGLDVWDISYYGFLDLVRSLDKKPSPETTHTPATSPQVETLLDQWRGMTVIIPNNYYQTAAGTRTAFSQLAKSQFIKAAADYDINFYVVGDSRTGGEELLATSLIPISDEKNPSSLKTQRDFLKHVRRWSKYVARSGEVVGGATKKVTAIADASVGAVHRFEIDKRTFLFQPQSKWLEQEARDLQRTLRKTDPLHRWVIVHRYDTGDTDTSWGFFRKRKVGSLEVRRTFDSSKGSTVLYEVDSIDMIDDDFINSTQNKHGIFLAIKFEDKVDRFIRLVSERTFPRFSEDYIDRPLSNDEIRQIGHELIDSILVDIYNEQREARTCRTWGATGVKPLLPKLNYLAERSLNYGLTYRQMQENEVTLPLLYELLANIRHMAKNSRTIWDSAIFPTAYFKRSRAVSSHMFERVDRIVTNMFGRELSWWDKWTSPNDNYDPFGNAKNKIPKGLGRDTANEQLKQAEANLVRQKVKLDRYTAAQTHPGLTYDPELLIESQRVISSQVYDRLVHAEQTAELERAKTEYAVAKQRSELLVPVEVETATAHSVRSQMTDLSRNR